MSKLFFLGIIFMFFSCISKNQYTTNEFNSNVDSLNISMYPLNELVDTPKIKILENGKVVEFIGEEVIRLINEQSNDSILFEVYPYYETLLLNLRRGIKYCQIRKVNMATVRLLLKYLDSEEQDWVAHLMLVKVSPTSIIYTKARIFKYEVDNNYEDWRKFDKEEVEKMWRSMDWSTAPLVSEW